MDKILDKIYKKPIETFKISDIIPIKKLVIKNLNNYLIKRNIDKFDNEFYNNLFKNREVNNIEIDDLCQCNSEHSRHWFFNGNIYLNDKKEELTLLEYIKQPLKLTVKNSIISFNDNGSAIESLNNVIDIKPSSKIKESQYLRDFVNYNPTINCETHNFPTSIFPFSGAATGVGGRIRDTQCIGRGSIVIGGISGYCVGNLYLDDYDLEWEKTDKKYQKVLAKKILIEASNGASDYGNKFGEPMILGFCRSYGNIIEKEINNKKIFEHEEFIKCIMMSAGLGKITKNNLFKKSPQNKMIICRIGGPAYRIGIGGSTSSSRNQEEINNKMDELAIQRGNAQMKNKLNKFILRCIELEKDNPILSIHDQGAGGFSNVSKEIIEPKGCIINLDNILLGDNTMSAYEIWLSEHQEQNCILINKKDLKFLEKIAIRENISIRNVGELNNTGQIIVMKNNKIQLNLKHYTSNRKKDYWL